MKLDYFIGEDIKKDYFGSSLVQRLTTTGEGMTSADGSVTVYLPLKLGFCHGVVRSVRMAMYTAEKYAGRNIYLINEMIHNPYVNNALRQHGIKFLYGRFSDDEPGIESVTADDVVIVPAFGGTTGVYDHLTDIGCTVVDTTCGEVASVWKRIERSYNTADYTSIVYGKHYHEETIATSSRANKYFIVKNLDETERLADYLRAPTAHKAAALMDYFAVAHSPGFDPERDLQRVGMASQTTMYASEFITASNIIKEAMAQRYGIENVKDHFMELDTICSATQERQDAMPMLLPKVEIAVIVGGYNSSNTSNLTRMSSEQVPSYHIEGTGKISKEAIYHQPLDTKTEIKTAPWLPDQPNVAIGLTSGASTPDNVLEDVLHELLAMGGGVPEGAYNMPEINLLEAQPHLPEAQSHLPEAQ